MRVFFFALAVLAGLLICPAGAQPVGAFAQGAGSTAACGGFQGVGDVQSGATFYGGVLAYNAASCGNSAIDLVRSSDSATCIGVKTGSATGILDVTVGTPCAGATVTSFCNATTCKVTKLYDQSGASNAAVQATDANRPTLAFSCIGSIPCIAVSGSTQFLQTTALSNMAPPYSFVGAAKISNNGNEIIMSVNSSAGNPFMGYASSTLTNWSPSPSFLQTTVTAAAFHALVGTSSSTALFHSVDGGANTTTTPQGPSKTAPSLSIGCLFNGGATCLNGQILEIAYYTTDVSSVAPTMTAKMKSNGGY